MLIIGISGKKRSGKNTVADFIEDQLEDKKVVQLAFADELKNEVAEACGVSRDFIEMHKDIFRPMLQWWGTDFRRKLFGENYWVDKILYKITQLSLETDVVIITDVRFQNEASMVQKSHGMIIRIERKQEKEDNHPSEIALDGYMFDNVINNDYSIDFLRAHTLQLLQKHNLI